jgi:ABC-type lipoprotein export system ATPase subunit
MPEVSLQSVTKSYSNGKVSLRILDSCDYTFQSGAFYSIVGRSGLGKTTLLRILGTIEKPDSGKITIDGQSILKTTEKEMSKLRTDKIGFIFQNYCLIERYTVEENMEFAVFFKGLRQKAAVRQRIKESLEHVKLDASKMSQKVATLSGGEKQRVAIARALVNDADLIFADEPTGNLDIRNEWIILKLLERINKDLGKTVIMVTHNMKLAKTADCMLTLQEGKIVEK